MIFLITEKINEKCLNDICSAHFKSFMKIVVDVQRKILTGGGELHSDGEAMLLSNGSSQNQLWGANYYPAKPAKERLEFTALINIRPSDKNFNMEVEDPHIREEIQDIAETLLLSSTEQFSPEKTGS